MSHPTTVDAVMRTLADPTRRGVFERIVGAGEISVGALTAGSGVTQGAISQHLKLLREAGLVAERPEGRHVYYHALPQGLAPLADWMGHYGAFWAERLATLKTIMEAKSDERPQDRNP
jgi:DNA-binding transcriptional ArsR family regulator